MNDPNSHSIRVLVVDLDSPLRDALVSFLVGSFAVEVVGVANNSRDAVEMTRQMHPDIVTFGGPAAGPGGVRAIREIMQAMPTRILVIHPAGSQRDLSAEALDETYEALRAGALTVVAEPAPSAPGSYECFLETLCLMAEVPVIHHWGREIRAAPEQPVCDTIDPQVWASRLQQVELIGIAASTGGPAALTVLLSDLPADFPIPIILVQHVTQGFSGGLQAWLDQQTALSVRLANSGDIPEPGTVLLAPDDHHIHLNNLGKVVLTQAPPYKGLRPSANFLFTALARAYGPQAMGIVLTGMGDDGAAGLSELHQAGGITVAQDECDCVVHGMPGEAIRRNAVECVLDLEKIRQLFGNFVVKREGVAREQHT